MNNIEQFILKKISHAPMLWMCVIVSMLGLLCLFGAGLTVFATSISFSSLGYTFVIISSILIYAVLRFYIKHDLAN